MSGALAIATANLPYRQQESGSLVGGLDGPVGGLLAVSSDLIVDIVQPALGFAGR